ncbi:hypothetical protein BCM02_11028 [Paenibacillus methanolicus]|uniref:Tryptophan synthase n=1 Tax=Paenibacillus methanolicus TaxID=582686 RepID=A0A5S5BVR5_9BACL|nr:hypothetical protein BCM02_11028 [Paenibacillus methanolicus]
MTHRHHVRIRQMQEAKTNGFEVIMFYVGLGDVRLNIERVAARVRNGGHHIDLGYP